MMDSSLGAYLVCAALFLLLPQQTGAQITCYNCDNEDCFKGNNTATKYCIPYKLQEWVISNTGENPLKYGRDTALCTKIVDKSGKVVRKSCALRSDGDNGKCIQDPESDTICYCRGDLCNRGSQNFGWAQRILIGGLVPKLLFLREYGWRGEAT